MSTILVTGASGFIGQALAPSLAERHDVICMSRRNPRLGLPWVRGDFGAFEDLRALDGYEIDAVVHLAAVTGGCIEREGILVNVEGTRGLLQYLARRGCRKMVLASSIAAVGFQTTEYVPERLPIRDEDGCQDRDGYGLSKYLMEEVTRYLCRQKPELDILAIRLSSASTNDQVASGLRNHGPWCLGGITYMLVDDAVDLFAMAVEAPLKPGLRIVNGVCEKSWSAIPTAEQLRHWYGDRVDVSFYDRSGNRYASAYDTTRLKEELGFTAARTLAILEKVQRD